MKIKKSNKNLENLEKLSFVYIFLTSDALIGGKSNIGCVINYKLGSDLLTSSVSRFSSEIIENPLNSMI